MTIWIIVYMGNLVRQIINMSGVNVVESTQTGFHVYSCHARCLYIIHNNVNSMTLIDTYHVDDLSANIEQPALETSVSRNMTSPDATQSEAADGHTYEKLQLEQSGTLIQVTALEAFIKDKDNNSGGFVQEYNVSSGC